MKPKLLLKKLNFQLSSLKIILIFSVIFPIVSVFYPKSYKYFYYDKKYLKTLQLWRLITAIFILPPEINSIFILLTRYNFLNIIEKNHICIGGDYQIESLFFIFSFSISLFLANFNGLFDFGHSFNMALCWFVCQFLSEINFYGFTIPSLYAPYIFLIFEIVLSRNHSAIYGLIHAICYFEYRKRYRIPRFFERYCLKLFYSKQKKKVIKNVRLIYS
ncbi:hypothetical protein DMUE_1452 [Dictyocoela muelleri]|nr:hypothetical protein DMUE_1452 [Dictyocoela muelleri]